MKRAEWGLPDLIWTQRFNQTVQHRPRWKDEAVTILATTRKRKNGDRLMECTPNLRQPSMGTVAIR